MKMIHVNQTQIIAEGSKSILNRVLLLSTYSAQEIILDRFSHCEDIQTFKRNLEILQFKFIEDTNLIRIQPPESFSSNFKLRFKDSATGLRFLIARLSAISQRSFRINFSDQLSRRPLSPLLEFLFQMGVKFSLRKNSIGIDGTSWKGGNYSVNGSVSSQFISAILLNAPAFKNDLELKVQNELVSESYLQMTIEILKDWGIKIEKIENTFFIAGNQNIFPPQLVNIEPDYSSLAYFWAIGAISREFITTEYTAYSLQGDHQFLCILESMGADIKKFEQYVKIRYSKLKGVDVSMRSMPDQVPTLAVLALAADSKTIIRDIDHLRYKESDRIKALLHELAKIGAIVCYNDNSLHIEPLTSEPNEQILYTYNDHRLVMAFSILHLIYPQITINEKTSVKKSNPYFFEQIQTILQEI